MRALKNNRYDEPFKQAYRSNLWKVIAVFEVKEKY
jgi:hypothetical protein